MVNSQHIIHYSLSLDRCRYSRTISLAEAPQACRQGPSGSDLDFRAYHALVVFWTYRMGLLSDVEDEYQLR